MLHKYFKQIICIVLMIVVSSCEIDEVKNPNDPNRDELEGNATLGELNNLVAGTESLFRKELGFYYDVTGIVGREFYFFTDADPRSILANFLVRVNKHWMKLASMERVLTREGMLRSAMPISCW